MNGRFPKRYQTVAAGAAIVLAGLLAYANTVGHDFVWDDASSILLHRHVQDPAQFTQLFQEDQHAFGRGEGNHYRPLTAASFMLDFALAHGRPEGDPETWGIPDVEAFLFQVSNVLWHILAGVFLLGILTRAGVPLVIRWIVPLLWVAHPLHTQAVAYISGRADPLAAAFMFAAVFLYLQQGGAGRKAAAWTGTLVLGAAAVLSRESAAILPVLLLLFASTRPHLQRAETLAEDEPASEKPPLHWSHFVPPLIAGAGIVVYGALRLTVLAFAPVMEGPVTPFTQRLVEAFQAFALYIRLLFAPTGLHMERTLDGVPGWVALIGLVLFLACCGLLAYCFWNGRRRAATGMAWFLLTWLPIAGVFPLNAPMAEHWMYVPMAGFWWAIAELIWAKLPSGRAPQTAFAAAAGALALAFLALTAARNEDWRDNESLYRSTLEHNPNSIRVHFNLAVTYEDLLDNPAGARRHFEQVLALYESREAEEETVVRFYDDRLEAHLSLGRLYLEAGRYQDAIDNFLVLLQVEPEGRYGAMAGEAAFGIGRALLAAGQTEEALGYFDYASELRPDLRGEADKLLIRVLPALGTGLRTEQRDRSGE
ncbi:MAG: hypothetical protein ACLFU6_08390 [Candidatus Hydrogenedentota bacterium]